MKLTENVVEQYKKQEIFKIVGKFLYFLKNKEYNRLIDFFKERMKNCHQQKFLCEEPL